MILNDKLYKVLKWFAIVAIPSLSGFFEVVLPVWDVPQQIITRCTVTTSAVGVLLAACLMVSNINYTRNAEVPKEEEV